MTPEHTLEPLAAFRDGDRVEVLPSRYDDFAGVYVVAGRLAPADLKLARHPGEHWELIVQLTRVRRADA